MGVEGEREWSKRAGREHERGGKESDGSLSRIRRRRRRCSSFFLFAREICSLFLLFQTYHRVVRVRRRHRCGGLRGQLIELGRGDALVDARGDLLGDEDLFFFFLKREREFRRWSIAKEERGRASSEWTFRERNGAPCSFVFPLSSRSS